MKPRPLLLIWPSSTWWSGKPCGQHAEEGGRGGWNARGGGGTSRHGTGQPDGAVSMRHSSAVQHTCTRAFSRIVITLFCSGCPSRRLWGSARPTTCSTGAAEGGWGPGGGAGGRSRARAVHRQRSRAALNRQSRGEAAGGKQEGAGALPW